ncbi:hypothetical protein AX16_008916 [Volvariella volvacea WC 439]|nr:hypothetical protein AX16_008916 [Volvariella volvacea WC 439]
MTSGNVQDLSRASDEALRALLKSIDPETVAPDGKISADAIRRLSDKLGAVGGSEGSSQALNSQYVNEEGLPIVDITETDAKSSQMGQEYPISAEPDVLVPLKKLPPVEQERLRQERNRILDQLEAEEREEREELHRRALQKSREALEKRKEAAIAEKSRLAAAREMQRKLGKALVQNNRTTVNESNPSSSGTQPSKAVKFAEDAQAKDDIIGSNGITDWGDIAPARLQGKAPATSKAHSQQGRFTMKMNVVERSPKPPLVLESRRMDFDSDDESEPPRSPLEEESESGDESLDTNPEDGGDEVNYASYQREIALEYYKKRSTVGAEAAKAMFSGIGNEKEVINGIPVIEDRPQKVISQFKASRLAAAYNGTTPAPSPLPSNATTPASSARLLQHAIRIGKLDENNQLVGTEASDSDSDQELQSAQEILDLLSKGEASNIGPGPALTAHTLPIDTNNLPPPKVFNKPTSRFKASKEHVDRAKSFINDSEPQVGQPQQKQDSTQSAVATSVMERKPLIRQRAPLAPVASTSSSFQVPSDGDALPLNPFSMIVESPDFPPPRAATQSRLTRPPTVMSSVKERSMSSRKNQPESASKHRES